MNTLSAQITKALSLIYVAHNGQVDKSGKPYVIHPLTVGLTLATQGYDDDTITAGLLHDVVEDTNYTIADLSNMGYSKRVLDALKLLTHDKSVDYMQYVANVKTNPIARAVKMADLLHNSDRSRLAVVTAEDEQRFTKYQRALMLLQTN